MIKLNQLTTAEAMSHPDVAATVNALGKMCDELRTQNQALRDAFKETDRMSFGFLSGELLADTEHSSSGLMTPAGLRARSRSR